MKRRPVLLPLLITGAAASAAALAAWLYLQPLQPPAPAGVAPTWLTNEAGLTLVTLDPATLARTGIQTATIAATRHRAEGLAYGSVPDIQSLTDLSNRYRVAQGEVAVAQATATASNQELQRSRALARDAGNVSQKSLQAAEATATADQARVESARSNLQALRASLSQQFGERLAQLVAAQPSAELSRLLNHQDSLLRIAIPALDKDTPPARISVEDESRHPVAAELLAPAPQSDPNLAGPVYLYRSAVPLPFGARLLAHLPTVQPTLEGVLIPQSAVLWFGGMPWAYVQVEAGRFVRRPLNDAIAVPEGYFVGSGFKAGEPLVVRGAQLLLSEEQRPQIAASACKDPECDD
ncbi:efflux RND transporter periplasmic adaptor subunit [Pseudomonas panipatensis]|uniref:Multidrug efflux pump subunit AcrA (Membrane-fusion protein) n=1 Tax=Pseudomonas panipatensis TaxID=428992 RepID=A0A1G8BFS2_9PSED|nr:hypothetical protein [Pseudomonas panipatensis]SDH32018.1 Multidrug efflux pump subunit AcrA (membrane-fusion protein) [Pseudomonas panipatensis]SMP71050.1 Multidrug efflux pump subunit AcrA (membrane-fusion protein) [Pseudomonas panipatensis]